MQHYKAPIDEMVFLLKAFGYEERVHALKHFSDFDLDTVTALLTSATEICVKEFLPLNRSGDQEGLKFNAEDHSVTTPKGFSAAYKTYCESGLNALTSPAEFGGSGGPEVLGTLVSEITSSCNKSLSMAPGLTHGLLNALIAYGTDEQKALYLPKMVSGEWTGTMCLTEPQCGTDLGLVSTKATDAGDGSYRVTGNKIWITFGEHDMAENIVHLVLARLPGAPEGIKGISTLLVPKFIDGKRNAVRCTGLEHKMGIHASPTCVISMEDATGYLVGDAHKGMRVMFKMMNMARLYVGVEGVSLTEISYQTALAFAKDRRQSRSLVEEEQDKDHKADNILVHPDVRRMFMNIKSTNEALRALAIMIAVEQDVQHHSEDEAEAQSAKDLVALLTPVIKSVGSERGFLNISEAMQICGGSGYTQDWNIEQYLRDERIALIYEGTNHIQALDLVGRKLAQDNGRLMQNFAARVTTMIRECKERDDMAEFIAPLKELSKKVTGVTMEMAQKGMADREVIGAVASPYLNLFGLLVLGYTWCVQVRYAIDSNTANKDTKLKTARYFMNNILPESETLIGVIAQGKSNLMEFDVDEL